MFAAQLARGVSMWSVLTAVPLLVLDQRASPVELGIVIGLQFAPALVIAPVAGAVADRAWKLPIMLGLQAAFAGHALALGALADSQAGAIGPYYLLAALFGVLNAVDAPIRQTLISDVVPRGNLAGAISNHIAAFNLTRVLGPALAGIVLGTLGYSWCFLSAAALSVVGGALLTPLVGLTARRVAPEAETSLAHALTRGVGHLRDRPVPSLALALLAITATFVMSIQTVLPVHTVGKLGLDSAAYGWFLSAMGLGSTLAFLPLRVLGSRGIGTIVGWGPAGLGLVMIALGLVGSGAATVVLMAVLGLTSASLLASVNAVVQLHVDDTMRGRVMGVFMAVFYGGSALGGVLAGVAIQLVGTSWAIACGATVVLTAGLIVGRRLARLLVGDLPGQG